MTAKHAKFDIFDINATTKTVANIQARVYGNLETRCGLDPEKMNAYEKYLRRYAKDKVVCDIGTGPGILAYLALRAGAKKVYCVESMGIECAQLLLEEYKDKVTFIEADAGMLDYPEDIEITIHEVLGVCLYDENILRILRALKKSNKIHTVRPHYWEMFSYVPVKRQIRTVDTYSETDFMPFTVDFHKLFESKFPGVINLHSNLFSMDPNIPLEDIKVFHTWSNNDPMEEWNKVPERVIEQFNSKQIIIGWRAYLDSDLYFGNYPRKLNNWGGIATPQHITGPRMINQLKQVQPIYNPFRENTCQFLS